MHANYFYNFKMALYSSAVVMKGFNSNRKLFKAKIITVKLKAGLNSFKWLITEIVIILKFS